MQVTKSNKEFPFVHFIFLPPRHFQFHINDLKEAWCVSVTIRKNRRIGESENAFTEKSGWRTVVQRENSSQQYQLNETWREASDKILKSGKPTGKERHQVDVSCFLFVPAGPNFVLQPSKASSFPSISTRPYRDGSSTYIFYIYILVLKTKYTVKYEILITIHCNLEYLKTTLV